MIPDEGYCGGQMLLCIEKGDSNGHELNGRKVVLALDWTGPTMPDGNGTNRLYFDNETPQIKSKN
jgi:hypothetical protein